MICTKCGNEVQENKFCSQCGTPAGSGSEGQSQVSYQPQQPAPPPMGYSAPPAPFMNTSAPPFGAPQIPQPSVYAVPRIRDYVIMQLIAMIPIAGFIMMIIWAVGGGDTPLWKSNFARAYWILTAIGIGIGIILSMIMVGVIMSLADSLGSLFW